MSGELGQFGPRLVFVRDFSRNQKARMVLRQDVLQRVAAERNVRSILFQFARITRFLQEPDVDIAVQALKTHGYRLGFIGDISTCDPRARRAFHVIHVDKQNTGSASVYVAAAKKLGIPLDRTLLVTLLEDAANDVISVTLPLQSTDTVSYLFLVQFVKDLLNFDQCLDLTGRCFGRFRVPFSQIFYESELSFALVNLKPIVSGHVLVVPKRPVPRFEMLDVDEVSDLWTTAQRVGKVVERRYGASSLTFAIQDGKEAGQTISHVHIHVVPRIAQDFKCNDDIYTKIEKHEQTLYVDNETRTARSDLEMAAEAALLRPCFSS